MTIASVGARMQDEAKTDDGYDGLMALNGSYLMDVASKVYSMGEEQRRK